MREPEDTKQWIATMYKNEGLKVNLAHKIKTQLMALTHWVIV